MLSLTVCGLCGVYLSISQQLYINVAHNAGVKWPAEEVSCSYYWRPRVLNLSRRLGPLQLATSSCDGC